jgi:hypothetical protein
MIKQQITAAVAVVNLLTGHLVLEQIIRVMQVAQVQDQDLILTAAVAAVVVLVLSVLLVLAAQV